MKIYRLSLEAIASLSTERLMLLRFTQAWDDVRATQETFDAIDVELRRRADAVLTESDAQLVEE